MSLLFSFCRMRIRTDGLSRMSRLVFAIMMSLVWSGAATYAQAPPADPASSNQRDQKVRGLLERLNPLMQTLTAADREIPRDSFDLRAVVQATGGQPDKIFEWVRDQTAWVPYRGALRGARGVLLDRVGNSLDRSILLAELLRAAGLKARLAHGVLAEKDAGDLLDRLLAADAAPTTRPAAIDTAAAPVAGDAAGAGEAAALQWEQAAEHITQRVAEQTPAIAAAVGPPAAQDLSALRAAARSDLADHWWTQCQQQDKWVDLDALLPNAVPGQANAVLKEAVELKDGPDKLPVDRSLCHQVVVRMVCEQWKDGKLRESTLLEKAMAPAEALGQRININHLPLDWPADMPPGAPVESVARLKGAVLGVHEWVPVLSIGADQIIQSSVTDSGEINSKPQLDPMARAGGKAGGAASAAIGAFDAAPPPQAVKASGQLTAEWVDYVIRCPGQPDRTLRRQVFDLLGPAARAGVMAARSGVPQAAPSFSDDARVNAGLSMLGQIDLLPLGGQPSPQFVEHLLVCDFVSNGKALAGVLRPPPKNSPGTTKPAAEGAYRPLNGALFGMAVVRQQCSRHRDDIYLDRPNLLAYHMAVQVGKNEQVLARFAFDVVANDVAVRPRAWRDAYAIRLEQGVLDTNAEALFVPESGRLESAARLYSAPENWVAAHNEADPQWALAHLPEDARERIRGEFAAGNTVIAPRKPIEAGDRQLVVWWTVDPKTGSTLGKASQGWGAAAGEYSVTLQRIAMFVEENKSWICMGKTCWGAASMVATILGMGLVSTAAGDVSQVLDAVCGEP